MTEVVSGGTGIRVSAFVSLAASLAAAVGAALARLRRAGLTFAFDAARASDWSEGFAASGRTSVPAGAEADASGGGLRAGGRARRVRRCRAAFLGQDDGRIAGEAKHDQTAHQTAYR
ncbi:hypothetical protein [Caballeronia sordidicola]|uniref:Uncharacterized protein n=1 Tax=Caballeronia sordidicola TaxID=196367 RepID=A0A226X0J2_CABSO|nr:hypothetical protein [Caballeronia sordidicola]OXC76961.1 hypothetical protein BSU04_18290 [Caballeronia sordidicola]